MQLHNQPKLVQKRSKRVGRGSGSGKGAHTAGRGQKGQKSRSSVPLWFEGGQLPLSRRLPFIRGKDRFKQLSKQTITVSLGQLASLEAGTKVDKKKLIDMGLISAKEAANHRVKLLATGQINVALDIIGLEASDSAKQKIQKLGGSFSENNND